MQRAKALVTLATLAAGVACAFSPSASDDLTPCETRAAARVECEQYFGAKIRAYIEAKGVAPMAIPDELIAQTVNQLCLDGHVHAEQVDRVRPYVDILNRHKIPFCG